MMRHNIMSGYLTVYMTITTMLIVSLSLALIEGVRSNGIRLETECIMDIGLNSIMAEYHRELLQQYNLFAIDASYGTDVAVKKNTENHLRNYLNRNMSLDGIFLSGILYRDFLAMSTENVEINKVAILTDDQGGVFRTLAVDAIQDDVGLGVLEEIEDWLEVIEEQELLVRDISAEKSEVDDEIMEYDGMEVQISEEEFVIVEIDNPTDVLEEKRNVGVLAWVVESEEELSTASIELENLISARIGQGIVNKGNMTWQRDIDEPELLERYWFQEYLLKYMEHYNGQKDETNALQYQMEYILVGDANDINNLKSVVNRLCAIREVANAIYLFSDEVKCMEADLLANGLAAAMLVPEIAPLLKVSILLGWAYAESLYDVEVLLSGGEIPLMKTADTWHYGLSGALSGERDLQYHDSNVGLSYEDYLRIFMMLTDLEVLTMRAMDMIEADMRLAYGNQYFRMDGCYVAIEATADVSSSYGYNYQITRRKSYKQ